MTLITPHALILLLTLPVIWYVGWPVQRFRRVRDITSLLMRTLIVVLLVLALGGARISGPAGRQAVIFLLDRSDSVGTLSEAEQLAFVQSALGARSPEDDWALVAFGADALVEQSFGALSDPRPLQSGVNRGGTDIARALQMALSLFPADATRRIVLLSDGQQTAGDALSKARLAAAAGIEIDTVPYYRATGPDLRLSDLQAPARLTEGQEFDIQLAVEADAPTPATVRIFADGRLIDEQAVDLSAGETRYSVTQIADSSGFLSFSAQVEAATDADRFIQNNQLASFSQVIGPPRLLLVTAQPEEVLHLLPALEQVGLTLDVTTPEALPASAPGLPLLAGYRSVIMANVPASWLLLGQMQMLDRYIGDLGGGLVYIGGPDSYAPGGYFRTPLEEVLPLDTQITDQQRLPQLTIAYLIDRSGSMAVATDGPIPNIELAKEAIIRSMEFLQPTDRAAVASFDTEGAWLAELQPVLDRRALQEQVAALRAGGGTDILAGLNLAARDIVSEPSERKHIILLTDGGASPDGLVELTGQLYDQHGVTTSVIAIGDATIVPFLEDMAAAGGGNYHVVQRVEQIPTIFTLETVLATRSYITETPFTPIISASSPIMDGITSAPPLRGYVASSPKETASVVLVGPEPFYDPLLATWQYGLGRVAAFTSDASARWAADWVGWDQYPRFWNQLVRWTMTEGARDQLETRVLMDGSRARVIVDARDADGSFWNDLSFTANLLAPDGQSTAASLRQAAPGQYEVDFTPDQEGAYFVTITGAGPDGDRFSDVSGWVMRYSQEYALTGTNTELLSTISQITGGRDLSSDPAAAFRPGLNARSSSTPIWPLLLVIALLLLPLDIAVRRLVITRSDLQRLRGALSGRQSDAAPDARLSSLRAARDRARQQITTDAEPVPSVMPAQRPSASSPTAPRPEPAAPTKPSEVPDESANIGSRLLQNRRRRQHDDL